MIRRIAALLGTVGLISGIVFFTPQFGLHTGNPIKPQKVAVAAQDLSLVCPGPIFKTKTGTNVGSFSQVATAFVYYSLAAGSSVVANLQPLGGTASVIGGITGRQEVSTPVSITARDSDAASVQGSKLLSVGQLQKIDSSWAAGLLGASCQRPTGDAWLLGGDTTTGRETLLILVNPTDVDSTVDLQLLASNGFVAASGLSSISVAKKSTTVVPINGIAPDLDVFAVHLTSRGGAVAAWLQHRAVRGTQAAGVDFVSPSGDAANSLVIPGLLIRGAAGAAEISGRREDFADIANVVRVANSSSKPADVLIRVLGADSKTFGTVVQAQVAANSVSDIPIGALDDGDYSIFISSDQPIRASAKLSRFNREVKPITDFAWLPALQPVSGDRKIAVPSSGITKLVLANSSKTVAMLKIVGAGADGVYKIKAGGLRSILVTGGVLQLSSDTELAATLLVDLDSSISGLPLVEYRNVGNEVAVAIR